MTIKALVPVRSGSTRVPEKNIRPFAGSSLLEIKLRQLKRIPQLDGIVVNSNDDRMLKLAETMGCEAVKRDDYYARNATGANELYQNIAEHFSGDIVLFANATNPLLKDRTIINAIQKYFDGLSRFDSVNTANVVKKFMFRDGKPLNYRLDSQPRSQDLPDILALNFAVNILSREQMLQGRSVVGRKPNLYVIDPLEATDIDFPMDFDFAEFVYKREHKI